MNHVRKARLTLTSNHGRNTSKNHVIKAHHTHPIMGETHPRTIPEKLNTHIRPWEEHIQEPCQKGSAYISDHGRNTSKNHVRKELPTLLTMGGTHPKPMSKRPNTHIWPHLVRKDLHLHLTMCKHIVLEWLCTYIWPRVNTLHHNGS